MKKPAVRAWIAAADQPWLITEEALNNILEIAARAKEESWESLATKLGKPLEHTRTVENRDGVAIVPVSGPIFRYANFFTEFSGGTTTQDLALDIQTAADDPSISQILLNVDSPGGDAAGINELAGLIRTVGKKKPVKAYTGGQMASAAYWLGSQAGEIIADPTAMLGSIGTVATFRDRKAAEQRSGITTYEIVSSKSPRKRMDPATDDGRAAVVSILDALTEEFIGSVAAGRGVTPAKVGAEFGQGGIVMARDALKVGMIDRLGSYEDTVRSMIGAGQRASNRAFAAGGSSANQHEGGPSMEGTQITAEQLAAAEQKARNEGIASGIKSERERISAIMSCEEAVGREVLARTIATTTELTPEAAKALLSATPKAIAGTAAKPTDTGFREAMAGVKNPKVLPMPDGDGDGDDDENKAVAMILGAGKSTKGAA